MRLIDADKVIEALHEMAEGKVYEVRKILLAAERIIHAAPSLDPEDLRPTGAWVDSSPARPLWDKTFQCSNCGGSVIDNRFNFCPRCGTRMEGTHEL